MKKEKTITKKRVFVLVFALLFCIAAIYVTHMYRPIPTYTVYQVGVQKVKVDTIRSLEEAKRVMLTYADAEQKINALVENQEGKRVAIAYGIVNLRAKTKKGENSSYYYEYMDRMQRSDFSYAADGLYQNTLSFNGNLHVQFQQSAVLGLIPLDEVELLNLFDEKEVSSFSSYEVRGGYLYHHVSGSTQKKNSSHSLLLGKVPFYFKDGSYYSWDGQRFFHNVTALIDSKRDRATTSKDAWIGFAPHYLYMSLTEKTTYTPAELETYISKHLDKNSPFQKQSATFFQAQKTYGVNALALFAACQANDAATPKEILQLAKTMSETYCNEKDNQYTGDFFGNKAVGMNVFYSLDPYWGEKAASLYAQMDLAMGQKDMVLALSQDKEQ